MGARKITRGTVHTGNIFSVESGGELNLKGNTINTLTIDGNKALTTVNSIIRNNGGALSISDGVTLQNNHATNKIGGAIFNSNGTVTINGGTITGNKASTGGAIYNVDSGVLTINGGKINGNESTSYAGAIDNRGTIIMTEGEIKNNVTVSRGGAIYNVDPNATTTISGGTIEGNTAGTTGGAVDVHMGTFNLSGDALIPPGDNGKNDIYLAAGKTVTVNGELTGEGQQFLLTPATQTVDTVVASVDGSIKEKFIASDLTKFKLNHNTLILNISDNEEDIKTVESIASYKNEGETDWTRVNSLKEAINGIETKGEVKLQKDINVGEGITTNNKEITLTGAGARSITRVTGYNGAMFNITGTVKLTGDSTNTLTIDGNKEEGTSTDAIINNNGTLTLETGITLQNNNTDEGGAIDNAGILVINGSRIINNKATGDGGAIKNYNTLTINSGTISGNTAGNNGGAINNEETVAINGGTISNNTAAANGGGIYNTKTLTVNGGEISSNIAEVGTGKAIFNGETLNMQGTVTINADNDIYLEQGKVIQVTGELDALVQIVINPYEISNNVVLVRADDATLLNTADFKVNATGATLLKDTENKTIILTLKKQLSATVTYDDELTYELQKDVANNTYKWVPASGTSADYMVENTSYSTINVKWKYTKDTDTTKGIDGTFGNETNEVTESLAENETATKTLNLIYTTAPSNVTNEAIVVGSTVVSISLA
eukprot:TRINITY_DN2980_c0_g2_i6.p1 TRINITY_DN2980_c0_g2~~TRINITY_DN2980_c0_g2_i6.p1  ORF type:complete len:798 (-),score=-18.84 TRINITY_DN2980_c0_g2_i6:91-2253(-)